MKKIIIVSALVVLCLIAVFIYVSNKEEGKTDYNSTIEIRAFNVEERTSLNKDGCIYVGNNIKELENGYYDIKISSNKDRVAVYINKLWYKHYSQDYIQDDYLARICRELSNKLNITQDERELEYILYKYIKDNYINVRKNIDVESIITYEYNLSLSLEDNVVKLIIQRGK